MHFYNRNYNTNGFILIFSDEIQVKDTAKYSFHLNRKVFLGEHCGMHVERMILFYRKVVEKWILSSSFV